MLPKDLKVLPPPCSNTDLVAKIAISGPIGNALQLALRDLIASSAATKEDESTAAPYEVDGDDGSSVAAAGDASLLQQEELTPMIDEDFAASVINSFGQAVANTNSWRKRDEFSPFLPQPALLKGRLEHYNRVGGQWRIMVRDAELSPRIPLDRNRKRRDRTSLWQVDNTAKRRRYGRSIQLGQTPLQILAYDDL